MTNTDDRILKALDTLTNTLREEMRQGFIQTDKKIEATEANILEQTDKKIESAKEQILDQSKTEHEQIFDAVYEGFEAEGKYAKGLEKRIEKLEEEVEKQKQHLHS